MFKKSKPHTNVDDSERFRKVLDPLHGVDINSKEYLNYVIGTLTDCLIPLEAIKYSGRIDDLHEELKVVIELAIRNGRRAVADYTKRIIEDDE